EIIPPAIPGTGPVIASLAFLFFVPNVATAKSIKLDKAPTVPASVSVTAADYLGNVNDRVAQIDATLQVSVMQPNQTLRLFTEEVVVQNFSAKPEARLVRDGKQISVLFAKKGENTLHMKLLVKLS